MCYIVYSLNALWILFFSDWLHSSHHHCWRDELYVVSIFLEILKIKFTDNIFYDLKPLVSYSDYCTLPTIKVHNIVVMMQ